VPLTSNSYDIDNQERACAFDYKGDQLWIKENRTEYNMYQVVRCGVGELAVIQRLFSYSPWRCRCEHGGRIGRSGNPGKDNFAERR
jgi:hypothetical protein